MSTTQLPDILGIADAAEYICIEEPQLRRYCRTGRIKATKVARDWIISKREATRFKAAYRYYKHWPKK
jgi:predicted site-specific integrase-resolvase